MQLQDLADALTSEFPFKKFDFGVRPGSEEWGFRYLISCIMVGGSRETATLAAGTEIFSMFPDVSSLSKASTSVLQEIMDRNGVRFGDRKASFIVRTSTIIKERWNGRVPDDRVVLESFPGVARHVASVILATVYDQPAFAVDVHVRRILGRFGYQGNDIELEQQVVRSVRPDLLGWFSRSFVDLGQTRCAATPNCSGCRLREQCSEAQTEFKPVSYRGPATIPEELRDYRIEFLPGRVTFQKNGVSTTVQVNLSKNSCTCQGYRFKKTCKHLKFVQTSA